MTARSDLVGRTYGRLTVVSYAETRNARAYWECRCECGSTTFVASCNLRETAGNPVRSCGCLLRETTAEIGRSRRKHGEAAARTVEYRTWRNIQNRCYNPNGKNWKYYGGMGVAVCDEWRGSFEAFLAHVGRRPSSRHSIDRFPDPYGNYEPGNVRWATTIQQRHNRRKKVNQ